MQPIITCGFILNAYSILFVLFIYFFGSVVNWYWL